MTRLLLRRLGALALLTSIALPTAAQTPVVIAPLPGDDSIRKVVVPIPDVTGDGIGDFAVGAPNGRVGGIDNAGEVFVYSGATGLVYGTVSSPNPVSGGGFGASIAGLPGANGANDIVIGAPGETVGGITDAGRVYVIGGASLSPLRSIESPAPLQAGLFGVSLDVGQAGPSPQDARILVGEPVNVASALGRAHLFEPDGALIGTIMSPLAEPDDNFGARVRYLPVAPFFGNRFDRILISANGETVNGVDDAGRLYRFSSDGSFQGDYTSPTPRADASVGRSVTIVSDVTGDGTGEVLLADAFDIGQVYLYDGASSALLRTYDGVGTGGAIPDLDGDGVDEHLIYATSGIGFGNIEYEVYSGASGRLLRTIRLTDDILDVAVGIPDTDGDGRGDILSLRLVRNASGSLESNVVLYRGTSATAALAGTEGWRLLTSPVLAPVNDFLSGIRTQGASGASTGSDGDPNVFAYTEALAGTRNTGFEALASLIPATETGRGYAVYVFEDDDALTPGTQGGFPKTLATAGFATTGINGTGQLISFPVTFTPNASVQEDGWNLLGNPYDESLDWDAADWTKTNVDNTIYVYDPAAGAYRTWNGTAGSLGAGRVAPFQGFWVKANAANPVLTSPAEARTTLTPTTQPRTALGLIAQARLGDATVRDEAFVSFQDDALSGLDRFDALELSPLNASYAALYATADLTALDVTALPALDASVDVPLGIGLVQDGASVPGETTLSWPDLSDIPAEWSMTLTDTETGAQVDLRTQPSYTFTAAPAPNLVRPLADAPLLGAEALAPRPLLPSADAQARPVATRFTLRFTRGAVATDEGAGAPTFEITGVRPNPMGRRGTVVVRLGDAAQARLSLFDALGREVAVLADGAMAEGRHEIALDPAGLAPGVYVVRWQSGGQVAAQTVTVLR